MLYTRMLVALDGSPISEAVLPYVRSFAKPLNIPVDLVHIIEPADLCPLCGASKGQFHEKEGDDSSASAMAYLERVAATFPADIRCRFSVETGNPAEVIVNRAAADSRTLIVMASHGHSGFQRWLLGSVAHKVASIATTPLLLVRAPDTSRTTGEAPLQKALVTLDGSELAEMALPHAAEVAKEMLLELVLVRAYDPLSYGHLPRMDQIAAELKAEAEIYLKEKVQQLKARGLEDLSYVTLKGYPAAEIVELARKTPDGVIVITTHGRSGVKKWLLGSVTERVISYATGPVLIIRAS